MYKKMLVFDGNHLAYRNFHTLRSLTNPKGLGIGCVFGVIGSIKKAIREYPEHRIVFCWDTRPKVRKELYPEYKAHRGEKPEWFAQLMWQIEQLKDGLRHLNVDQYQSEGYEADDLGWYMSSVRCEEYPDGETVLVTSDSDWLQLVDDDLNVRLYDPIKSKKYTNKEVCSKIGIQKPRELAMFKAITGDKSDNVPKIPRFPTKLALELSHHCPTPNRLDHYIGSADPNPPIKMSDKWKQSLKDNMDMIQLNFKLVYLGFLEPKKIEYTKGQDDVQMLKAFYKKHGFKSYLGEMAKQELIRGVRPGG